MPLGVVVAAAFAGLLALGLAAVVEVESRRSRRARAARLAELHRYRVVGAYALPAVAPGRRVPTIRVVAWLFGLTDQALRSQGRHDVVVDRLDRAGMRIGPAEWVAVQVAAVSACAAAGALLTGSPFGLLAGVLGRVGCLLVMSARARRRTARFESQLADALQLAAGALRVGLGVSQSLAAVARDAPDPVGAEFGRALQQVRLGTELEDALQRLAERMDSYDLELVALAVRTVREVGGNLAETLESTAAKMRERAELRGQVQVLTAEARLSAKVLFALPLLMGLYLFAFRRAYLQPMISSAAGVAMLAAAVVLLGLGAVWLRRLTRIEV